MIGTQGWELGGKIWKSVGHFGNCRTGRKMLAIIGHSWLLMLLTGSSLSFWLNKNWRLKRVQFSADDHSWDGGFHLVARRGNERRKRNDRRKKRTAGKLPVGKWPIEIVDLPIYRKLVIFHSYVSYVSLPEASGEMRRIVSTCPRATCCGTLVLSPGTTLAGRGGRATATGRRKDLPAPKAEDLPIPFRPFP